MFTIRKSSFDQILYGNYHWVTVSGNKKGEISFYDPLNNGNIPRVFLHQICDIIRPETNKISVKVQPVQQQSNQVGCGVFSIAFAGTLALGDNRALVTYDQTSLRFLLNKFLKLGKFFPYPVINGKRQKRAKRIAITGDVSTPTGEHIFNKKLKKVLIILWHHAVFVRTGFIKSEYSPLSIS